MKRHHPKQSSFDFGGENDGRSNNPIIQISSNNRNSALGTSSSCAADLVSTFDDGSNCPIPDRFPTGGTRRTYDALTALDAARRHDWRELRQIPFRWYCWNCNHWHEFSERFFQEFKGVYP